MAFLSHPSRLLPALLVSGMALPAIAQTQNAQPPANYHGPDTYGICAYVIGDTEYYGRSFHTSSFFKSKAEQDIREYAQTQGKGAPNRAHCIWSYREADLATIKETDRRLIGMPRHPAKFVETGWTFQGGTVGGANAVTASNTAGTNASTVNGTQAGYVGRNATNASTTSATRTATSSSPTGTGTSATSAASSTTASGTSTTTGSLVGGGAQQSLSDAKNNAVSTAAGGLTTATNSAMGALSSGMQNMFHRKQAQPQQANGAATTGGSNSAASQGQTVASAGATQEGFGFVADRASATGGSAASGAPAPASATLVEGLVADVSGRDIIINVGAQAGVRQGSTLVVTHAQRTVNDPLTGKPLRTIESQVGELKITGVDAGSASGVFSGSGVPVVGDKVRTRP